MRLHQTSASVHCNDIHLNEMMLLILHSVARTRSYQPWLSSSAFQRSLVHLFHPGRSSMLLPHHQVYLKIAFGSNPKLSESFVRYQPICSYKITLGSKLRIQYNNLRIYNKMHGRRATQIELRLILALFLLFWLVTSITLDRVNQQNQQKDSNCTLHASADYASKENKYAQSSAHYKFSTFQSMVMFVQLLVRLPKLASMWLPLTALFFLLGPTDWWLRCLVYVLENSGPGFVKLGQWAATRPDLFDERVTNVLARLQKSAKPHSFKYTIKTIRQSFPQANIVVDNNNHSTELLMQLHDANPNNLYLVVDGSAPLGSGSMAQVHRGAVSEPNGGPITEVAIKVLHPHVRVKVEQDLMLMRIVAGIIDRLPGGWEWIGATDGIRQFSGFLHSHLNLQGEGLSLERFGRNFASWNGLVQFPRPVAGLSAQQVLVETLEKGTSLADFMATNSPALRAHARSLARVGLKMFLTMMIDHNFIHSDLHPGNLLVDIQCSGCKYCTSTSFNVPNKSVPNNEFTSETHDLHAQARLIVLDPGLVTELSPRNRENFLSLFGAIVEGDGRLAAELMLKNARKASCSDPERFKEEMHLLVNQIPTFDLGTTDIGLLLQKCLRIVRLNHIGLETDFASLVVSLVVVEGVGRALDPGLSLVKEAIPVLTANPEARRILVRAGGQRLLKSLIHKARLYRSQTITGKTFP